MDLTLYVVSHDPALLDAVPALPWVQPVNLRDLPLGPYQTDQLAEQRVFLADLPLPTPYVGLATARWHDKYPDLLPLEDLAALPRHPKKVWAACLTHPHWPEGHARLYPGILPLLAEVQPPAYRTSLWANNLICHADVWADLEAFWLRGFHQLHGKYGWDLPFTIGPEHDANRKAAYLYELLSVVYFEGRTDLDIYNVPNRSP